MKTIKPANKLKVVLDPTSCLKATFPEIKLELFQYITDTVTEFMLASDMPLHVRAAKHPNFTEVKGHANAITGQAYTHGDYTNRKIPVALISSSTHDVYVYPHNLWGIKVAGVVKLWSVTLPLNQEVT